MTLYKLEYEQRNEVFVEANNADQRGIRLDWQSSNKWWYKHAPNTFGFECGWSVVENLGG